MKVFFSYASEDGPIVDQVYRRVTESYPDTQVWLDKYQIVGGNDLIEKISDGIRESDKFLIFLSSQSIDKPWVRAELKQALTKELKGVNPDFIVPVKLGAIASFPPFIESKRYIDLELKTEDEWLGEIYASIVGIPTSPQGGSTPNLLVQAVKAADDPTYVIVAFEARYWAENIGFQVRTKKPILSSSWKLPRMAGMALLNLSEKREDCRYGIHVGNTRITPNNPFWITLKFEDFDDTSDVISSVERWDGADGIQTISAHRFPPTKN